MTAKMGESASVAKKPETRMAKNLRIFFGIAATLGFLFLFAKIAMNRFG